MDESKEWIDTINLSIRSKTKETLNKNKRADDAKALQFVQDVVICKRMGYSISHTKPLSKCSRHADSSLSVHWYGKQEDGVPSPQFIQYLCLLFLASTYPGSKLGTKEARILISRFSPFFNKVNCTARCMIVLPDMKRITPSAKKIISTVFKRDIVYFNTRELLFDPIDHFLFPKCRRLSCAEVQILCKRLGISDSCADRRLKLPHILSSDTMCRFMGFAVDDVVEIHRGTHLYWRIVILDSTYT